MEDIPRAANEPTNQQQQQPSGAPKVDNKPGEGDEQTSNDDNLGVLEESAVEIQELLGSFDHITVGESGATATESLATNNSFTEIIEPPNDKYWIVPTTAVDETDASQSQGLAMESSQEVSHESTATGHSDNNDESNFDIKQWRNRTGHLLVMSRAGKPIFSRYGDENQVASEFGFLQALVSRSQDKLGYVQSKDRQVVFMIADPLLLVMISSVHEPVSYVRRILDLVHSQFLFHFTSSALRGIFQRSPGFDLRSLLGNVKREVNGLLSLASYSTGFFMNGVPTLHLPSNIRDSITDILLEAKNNHLLYALLIADNKIVSMVSPKKHFLYAQDLHLLLNFVSETHQLRTQETWTPLCLSHFNNDAFLHAYCAYIQESVCLVLLSTSEDLDQEKNRIAKALLDAELMGPIVEAIKQPPFPPSHCEASSAIHLLFKSVKTQQCFETSVSPHAPMHRGMKIHRKRLVQRYVAVHERVHHGTTVPRTATWDVGTMDSVLAVVTDAYELYATFHPFTQNVEACAVCNRFRLWVRKQARSLFMHKLPTW